MTQEKKEPGTGPANIETAVGELRTEVRVRFAEVDKRFEQVNADIRELRGDMNTLKNGLISATTLILATVIGSAVVF